MEQHLSRKKTPPANQVTLPKPPADDAVVRSPFVIDATTDHGYQATSTLAGSFAIM